MTDYWKSQERKYCDFCKCWITDNKPSVQFHENGKRHKENVAKKISELTKKSTKAQKESKKISEEMKKMEEAAMKAYMKDMEMNPDFTSLEYKRIQEEKAEAQKEEVKDIMKQVIERKKDVKKVEINKDVTNVEINKGFIPIEKNKDVTKPGNKTWYEAKSDEGHTYYWNTTTKESVWEPPEEGFFSLEEQKKDAEVSSRLQESLQKEASEEVRAWAAREEMKKFKKVEEKKIEEYPGPILGPAPKVDPYGSWKAVENKVKKPIDWQLPQVAKPPEISVPEVIEPKSRIKEKKISSLESLADDVPTVFKKRKPNPNRGNIRQRIEED